MASLQQETSQKGSALAILLFPVHIQVLGSYEDHWPQDRCRELYARRGISFMDPVPALRANWQAKEEKLFYDHCHYTPNGYTVVARTILAWLDRKKLIPD